MMYDVHEAVFFPEQFSFFLSKCTMEFYSSLRISLSGLNSQPT